jgi:hypothetical protein
VILALPGVAWRKGDIIMVARTPLVGRGVVVDDGELGFLGSMLGLEGILDYVEHLRLHPHLPLKYALRVFFISFST